MTRRTPGDRPECHRPRAVGGADGIAIKPTSTVVETLPTLIAADEVASEIGGTPVDTVPVTPMLSAGLTSIIDAARATGCAIAPADLAGAMMPRPAWSAGDLGRVRSVRGP